MLIKIPGHQTKHLPVLDYPGPSKAGVGQKMWKTDKLTGDEYLITGGLTACTGLALWDPDAHVASLAHFDSTQAHEHIRSMIAEMEGRGAQLSRIRAAVSGWEDFNMSATGVYNDLREAYQGPVDVYAGRDVLVVFGDGRVGWFGLD